MYKVLDKDIIEMGIVPNIPITRRSFPPEGGAVRDCQCRSLQDEDRCSMGIFAGAWMDSFRSLLNRFDITT